LRGFIGTREGPVTDDILPLPDRLAEAWDVDFLRDVAEATVHLLMEADMEGLTEARRHERSGRRTTYCNSYRSRSRDTRLGGRKLRVPTLRQRDFSPRFLERRKTSAKALVAVIEGQAAKQI
jgi:transposase-like protein